MSYPYSPDRPALDTEDRAFDLRGLLAVFRRRWKTVLAPVALLVSLAAIYAASSTRIYSADAELLIEYRSGEISTTPTQNVDPARRLLTEVSVIEGRGVRELVEATIGADAPTAKATPSLSGGDTIKLVAESPDPKRAVETVNTYAKAFKDFREQTAKDDIDKTAKELQKSITKLEADATALRPPPVSSPSSATTVTVPLSLAEQANLSQLTQLKSRLQDLLLRRDLQTGGVSINSPGVASTSPVSPKTVPLIGAALVLGLALGLAAALLRETLNDRLADRGDVEAVTQTAVLAEVNTFATTPEDPIGVIERQTAHAEAFNGLRASMSFLAIEGEIRSLLITSALPGEGKSTVAMSIAATYALSGSTVLLIDADLRRPDVHNRLGLDNDSGLSVILSSGQSYKKFVQEVPHYAGLDALTSGPIPPNPFELLASEAMSTLMKKALTDYDIIIVDCPPVRPVSDVMALVGLVDGVVMVTNEKLSLRTEVGQAVRSLRQVDAKVIGAVLNQTKIARSKYIRYEQ